MKSKIDASPGNQGESIMPCSRNAGWAESDAGALSCPQAASTLEHQLSLQASPDRGLCSDQPLLGVGVDRCLDYFKFRECSFE